MVGQHCNRRRCGEELFRFGVFPARRTSDRCFINGHLQRANGDHMGGIDRAGFSSRWKPVLVPIPASRPLFQVSGPMSGLPMGEHPSDDRPSPRAIYVLLRSFEARVRHLRELEEFRAQLPGHNTVQFLLDPLSEAVPSYHAVVPRDVRGWIETRQELQNMHKKHSSDGILDQSDGQGIGYEYAPDEYTVSCRNSEQLEKHITELEAYAASRNRQTPLKFWRTSELYASAGFGYYATLPHDLLDSTRLEDLEQDMSSLCVGGGTSADITHVNDRAGDRTGCPGGLTRTEHKVAQRRPTLRGRGRHGAGCVEKRGVRDMIERPLKALLYNSPAAVHGSAAQRERYM
ncbi:hypothetical protein DFH09DRAFT_1074858 [Mycena vulgaris]|nr:hypothetical protein DFH09DRAFT_1074858 [Mycena vulgaris]